MLSGAAQIIPEGFVDLIRRVTPGVMFWMLVYFLTGFPRIRLESVSGGGFLLFVLVAYATGLAIDGLTESVACRVYVWLSWTEKIIDSRASRISESFALKASIRQPAWSNCAKWEVPGLLRAEVIEANARAAIVLPKLVAEECLLRNVAGALLLALVVLLASFGDLVPLASTWTQDHRVELCLVIAVCTILVFFASVHRARRTVIRTLEWVILTHSASQPAAGSRCERVAAGEPAARGAAAGRSDG